MSTENDWCLFVFVRTALASMNPGKSQAHASHAANAFVWEHYINQHEDYWQRDDVYEWMQQTEQGFGTQLNLKAETWDDINKLSQELDQTDYPYNFVTDPQYPYEVSDEVYELLDDRFKVGAIKKKGKYVCFREEVTAFYVFGRRSDLALSKLLKRFRLHP